MLPSPSSLLLTSFGFTFTDLRYNLLISVLGDTQFEIWVSKDTLGSKIHPQGVNFMPWLRACGWILRRDCGVQLSQLNYAMQGGSRPPLIPVT